MKYLLFSLIGSLLLSCGDSASNEASQSNQDTSNKKKNEELHLLELEEELQPGNITEISRGDDAFESVRKLVGDSAQLSRGDAALKHIQDQLNQ
jgi:hypothetical protein